MAAQAKSKRLIALIPVFNDWEAVGLLLPQLDRQLATTDRAASVLVLDDGSTEPAPADLAAGPFAAIQRVEVLSLHRNLGHQRALATGLCHVSAQCPCDEVLVMDGDGEDDPADVPRLLDLYDRHGGKKIVFAARAKRSESFLFRAFYLLYRMIHWLLTGIAVRVGNFSVIPAGQLPRLVAVSELWNHYAAAVVKARLPLDTLQTRRGKRITGRSRMNFVSLVIHGLSAISVFSDRVGARLLTVCAGLTGLVLLSLLGIVGVRLGTDWAVPGWATYTSGILLVVLMQVFMLVLVFAFLVLSGRDHFSFLPIRDYRHFVGRVWQAYPAEVGEKTLPAAAHGVPADQRTVLPAAADSPVARADSSLEFCLTALDGETASR